MEPMLNFTHGNESCSLFALNIEYMFHTINNVRWHNIVHMQRAQACTKTNFRRMEQNVASFKDALVTFYIVLR